jgi:CTP:molybdopterin cytidylyltransferase MocA
MLLTDMPFVSADMIATLVARYRAGAAMMVVSEYAGVQAPLADLDVADDVVRIKARLGPPATVAALFSRATGGEF